MSDNELTNEERACLAGEAELDDLAQLENEIASEVRVELDHSADQWDEDSLHRALIDVWRDFALRWSAALGERLRAETQIDVGRIVQPSYGEFVFALVSPTCFMVAQPQSDDCPFFIELHPNILLPMIDRLLGSGIDDLNPARRPLTLIEKRIAQQLAKSMIEEMAAAWQHIAPMQLSLRRTESNPRVVRVAHPGDPMVVVEMNIKIGDASGSLRIGMTWTDIERLQPKIIDPHLRAESNKRNQRRGRRVSIVMAESQIAWDELMNLRVGDIVTTDASADAPSQMMIDDRREFLVQVGSAGSKKAAKLIERIDPERASDID